ncbi:probable sodium/metabolite cotransporter BASS4, chloroplastic [Tanacetum coccineum]
MASQETQQETQDQPPLWEYVTKLEKQGAAGGVWKFQCNLCSETRQGSYSRGDVSQDQDRGIQELALPNASLSVESVLKFISTNLLALALFGASVFALINPGPGCFAHRYKISTFSTIGIFLITGLTLRNEEIGEAAEAWPVGLFGLVSILLLTPFISRIMVNIRLQPQEFVTGLALYNCMPTSISSGVSLAKVRSQF